MSFHEGVAAPGTPALRTGGLAVQRACTCGSHTSEGECDACRGKRAAVQRAERTAPDAAARATEAAPGGGLESDFSGVSLSAPAASPALRTPPRVQRMAMLPGLEDPGPAPAAAPEAAPAPAPAPEAVPGMEPAASESEADAGASGSLIVEDAAPALQPGQLRKSAFMDQLYAAVCAAAEAALAGTPQSAAGCPYLAGWFAHYRGKSSAHIESAMFRYAPETRAARTAAECIPLAAARVRQGVEHWVRTGEVTAVPEEDVGAPMAAAGDAGGGAGGGVQLKERGGGGRRSDDPRAVQRRLGPGQALDAGVRGRMERAFGQSFAHVRTHTDPAAERLSTEQSARAFTVGEHVAFGAGEYRPGTPVGEALIAHELAHVVQQGGASPATQAKAASGPGYGALEQDADNAAVGAVVSLWGKASGAMAGLGARTLTGLKSGLRLQRCKSDSKANNAAAEYLAVLTSTGKIEGGTDSQAHAREVVELWKQGQGQFILSPQLKALVIKELLNVPAGADGGLVVPDENQSAIADLMMGMGDAEIAKVMGDVGETIITGALKGDHATKVAEHRTTVKSSPGHGREVFDADKLMKLRDEFVQNAKLTKATGKLDCITILSTQLEKLYAGDSGQKQVRESMGKYGKAREYKGKQLAESTLPNLMSHAEEAGLTADKFVTDFTRDAKTRQPTGIKSSPWDGVKKMVGDVHGWHFFTLALMDGFHSVSLFVENRPTGMFLYFADQNDSSLTSLLEPGSVPGFRQYSGSKFDEYLVEATKTFWDSFYSKCTTKKGLTGSDFHPACDSATTLTIWKLHKMSAAAATPAAGGAGGTKAPASGGTRPKPPAQYTVKKNDTLSGIAAKFDGLTVARIQELNNLQKSTSIRPGQILILSK